MKLIIEEDSCGYSWLLESNNGRDLALGNYYYTSRMKAKKAFVRMMKKLINTKEIRIIYRKG